MLDLKQNIEHFERTIGASLSSTGLQQLPRILAVSKGQSEVMVRSAYQLGLTAFGENYLQEAIVKMAALSDCAIEWHYIGRLQSRKLRAIAQHFSWVQSVTTCEQLATLNQHVPNNHPPLNICLQVNIDQAPEREGILPNDCSALAKVCETFSAIRLRGLMCIPLPDQVPENTAQRFSEMQAVFQDLKNQGHAVDTLSMGMSTDYALAVRQGSTMLRLGTAIFGRRKK